MKFNDFCNDHVVLNVALQLLFIFFCHDHGVVKVGSVGIKIYLFCHDLFVVNVVGVMT